jgi:hypothetical protein
MNRPLFNQHQIKILLSKNIPYKFIKKVLFALSTPRNKSVPQIINDGSPPQKGEVTKVKTTFQAVA